MAVSARKLTRQRDYSRLFIALAVVAGIIALAPIVAAIAGVGGTRVGPRTAYATAPAGEYMILGRSEGSADVISVVRRGSADVETEIVRIPHLEGFATVGSVSPDGKRLAIVVADGGTASRPIASLNIVALETGRIVRAAEDVAPGLSPIWTQDGSAVVATRSLAGNETQGPIALLRADAGGGGEEHIETFDGALGVYPVGFDDQSRLVTVVLDSSGTTLHRTGADPLNLTSNLTRDWRLSPDGRSIAFVEVDTSAGVQYLARTESLAGESSRVAAQSLSASVSALGTAWNPATNTPAFGKEPTSSVAGIRVQSLTATATEGFDVPLGFSESGVALVVTHWSGGSFEEPGRPQLQLIDGKDRIALENQTRFFGWASR